MLHCTKEMNMEQFKQFVEKSFNMARTNTEWALNQWENTLKQLVDQLEKYSGEKK